MLLAKSYKHNTVQFTHSIYKQKSDLQIWLTVAPCIKPHVFSPTMHKGEYIYMMARIVEIHIALWTQLKKCIIIGFNFQLLSRGLACDLDVDWWLAHIMQRARRKINYVIYGELSLPHN